MMSVTWTKGDLFASDLEAVAHGCNCVGAMGAGIAVEFRRRWPKMYQEYRDRCKAGKFNPGGVYMYATKTGLFIFNLATQPDLGGATIEAISDSLQEMVKMAKVFGVAQIGMPAIGAGLGGLDWAEVKEVIQRVGDSTPIELVVFEEYVPG